MLVHLIHLGLKLADMDQIDWRSINKEPKRKILELRDQIENNK